MLKQVEGNSSLARNDRGNVINTDKASFEQAKAKKNNLNRIDNLEKDVSEIKCMLKELLSR